MKSERNRKVVGELAFSVLIAVSLREQGPTQGRMEAVDERGGGGKTVRGGQRGD